MTDYTSPVCDLCVYSTFKIKWEDSKHAFLNCDGSLKVGHQEPQGSPPYEACSGTVFGRSLEVGMPDAGEG